ncbi:MAG: NitT/TauT family transport system substrate-binding protein [Verrucomicrobia bacterium]|nr:MAG: NitT/TauT family transport system substrate-binding protein [Verrucomicrobiota bacterium]
MKTRLFPTLFLAAVLGSSACSKAPEPGAELKVLRFGHFPNITHVQALVAHQLSRQGKGWFEERLGVPVEWYVYNAGPSATEAIFARSLDVTYIGPSPVLNAYAKSKGTEMRVLAGGANGGSSLITRNGSGITDIAGLRGKKIASPQLGNTQDVQLRALLADNGFQIKQTGGDAFILPTANADLLPLFQKGELDAAWTVEPWVTRLQLEAGAKTLLEDRETNITLLTSSASFVDHQPDLAKKLIAAHLELTQWINEHPAEAKALIKAELTELMKAAPKDQVVDQALSRIAVTGEISRQSLDQMVISARKAGFLEDIPALDRLLPSL